MATSCGFESHHRHQHPPVLKGTGGYFLLRRRQIILSVREAGKNCVGGRNLAGEIQVRVNIGCGRDIAMSQPFLYFFQAHSIGIQQAGAAMSQIMKTYLFQLVLCQQNIKMQGDEIGLDGFMASKMLKAAAEWEAEEAKKLDADFVEAANNVVSEEKKPEELIDYLVRTVQLVRPQYSRNTIINIAICTTQGFLTVFSGEPGCGKTSICNIYSDALGLNKIEKMITSSNPDYSAVRYVPVSVERGWTSKRDFIGYYNPLSKSFDKSNRDVYDALNRLHIEQNSGLNKFPLLSSANGSLLVCTILRKKASCFPLSKFLRCMKAMFWQS